MGHAGSRRRQGVVDVVQAGDRQPDVDVPAGQLQPELRGFQPVGPNGGGAHLGPRPLEPAGGAAPAAQVAEIDRLVDQPGAAPRAPLGIGGVLHRRAGGAVVLQAERDRGRRRGADRRHQRIVDVVDHRRTEPRRRRPWSASGRRSAPARRSGRAGRETGCPAPGARGEERRPRRAAPPRRPRTGPPRRGRPPAARMPRRRSRLAPPALRHSRRPSASSTAAAILAVVVLPLVAEITVVDVSRPASRPIASGSIRSSSFPGSVVPPPARLSRVAVAVARAAASLAVNSIRSR